MPGISNKDLSEGIKRRAAELGFNICGIARARVLGEYGPRIRSWVNAGMNDNMGYLARNIDKRIDPVSLFPDALSLVVAGLSYYSKVLQKDPEAPVLSRYTYGRDYHEVIPEKLNLLLEWINTVRPGTGGRAFTDSSAIAEKPWGREAGLGWQGRHSVLINKSIGSFFFLGILILDTELDYDDPFDKDHCGNCRLCIEACPTDAINDNRTIDARKCIANLTIENRGPVPEDIVPHLGRRVYGCDICQEVCPWNKDLKLPVTPEFTIDKEIAEMSLSDWQNLTRERFSRLFGKTSMSRVKYEKFMSNIEAATKSGNR
ncbi:MAG: tRNA epoxyqueuosine(34) reductase QueG [Bacteroidales bacterium]|nr:tRNA epoxyqueuosine(34) reductase QueG [Bacteroidales bacterium]